MHTIYLVIIIIVVICVILMLLAAMSKAKSDKNRGSRSASSSSDSRSSSSDSRSPGRSRYRVEKGNPIEQTQAPVQPKTEVQASNGSAQFDFPRHEAKANRRVPTKVEDWGTQFETEAPRQDQAKINNQAIANNPIRTKVQNFETIHVRHISELFSPKEDTLDEFGVTPQEMEKMVEAYKKKQVSKEPKLPINKNFNLESYNKSKETLRASSIHGNATGGSKRGQITKSIYKKYGKNFASKQSAQAAPDVMASIPNAKQHEEAKERQNLRRNPGQLVVRN